MENIRTRPTLKHKNSLISVLKKAGKQTVFFIISYCLSGVSLGGTFAPFSLGFSAGVPCSFLLSASAACALGSFMSSGIFDSLRCVTAVCITAFIRTGFENRINPRKKMMFSALLTFISYFLSGLAVFIAAGEDVSYLVRCAGEAVIASAFSCFTFRVINAVETGKQGAFFSYADISAFMFTGAVIILGISRFEFMGFSPGRLLAYFTLLMFSYASPPLLASAAGASLALTLGFNEAQPQLMLTFASGGLACGICGSIGKGASSIALLISSALSLVLMGDGDTAIIALGEAGTAGLIFLLLPGSVLKKLVHAFTVSDKKRSEEEQAKLLSAKLMRSAKAVRDVSDSVLTVSGMLKKTEKPRYDKIADSVREDVCEECSKKDFCWVRTGEITGQSFIKARDTMIEKGRLRTEDLPDRINLICRKKEALTDSFNRFYCEYNARLCALSDINDAKASSARMLGVMSCLLDDTARQISTFPESTPDISSAAATVLRDAGAELNSVTSARLKSGRYLIEAFCKKVPPLPDPEVLSDRLYDLTGIVFSPPETDGYSGEGTVLSFYEEGKFSVTWSKSSHSGAGQNFSGDTAECFFDGSGCFYAVLSDGMGTGSRAALDSVMTCSLMSRLLRSGFSPETALSAVNCALMIKSSEETISTLDILKIDTDTGRAEFYKAGAAASVAFIKGRTLIIEKSSMPLGIITETGLIKSDLTLSPGDCVLIMSDGASLVSPKYYKSMAGKDIDSLTRSIVKKAIELSPSGRNDDITVIAVKIDENEDIQRCKDVI